MPPGPVDRLLEVLGVGVDGTSHERRLRRQRDRERADRPVDRPVGARLRALADLGRGGRLALGQAVDAVVEHHELDVHVAAHRVEDVVAPDGEGVAVAGDDPDHEVRPCGLQARREGRRTSVDRVEPVGAHVIGQSARAADPRDEHDVLLGLREDRVVPAARAPAHFLVRHEVLAGEDRELGVSGRGRAVASRLPVAAQLMQIGHAGIPVSSSLALSSISLIRKGLPRTRLSPSAGTRNFARTSHSSCPRLISGTSTRR